MPKEIGWALGLRSETKKNITIGDNVIKVAKKEKKDNIYEYASHILNHEMMHVLIQDIPDVGNALTEAIVEVAASRTSFGKDKKRMKNYREETLGYGNITFGVNILSAAMGVSEKEFIQLAFEHKISEELENKGIKNYKPSLELVQGFGPYSPKEISNMQTDQRNILNARIAILERLSKEFKNNEVFKGENGEKNKRMVMLYIQKFTTSTRDIYYIQNKLKELYNIDLSYIADEYIKPGIEKEFELKPETIKKIEKEDFSSYYDKNNIEMMKKALTPSIKTRLKNGLLKMKGKIFKRKKQLALPECADLTGKIRPEKKMRLYGENIDIENEEEKQPW